MNGVRGNASGAAVAVALLFVAFCLSVAAVRGTYYDVWRALDAQATGNVAGGVAAAGASASASGGN